MFERESEKEKKGKRKKVNQSMIVASATATTSTRGKIANAQKSENIQCKKKLLGVKMTTVTR